MSRVRGVSTTIPAPVSLRPMSADEFEQWRPVSIADYAAERVRAGSMPAESALAAAREEFASLLPEGVATPTHHLLVAESAGSYAGLLWLHVPDNGQPDAFIYNIEVSPELRGRGLGRAIMLAAEGFAREHGASSIRLHVFGGNDIARSLYRSLGYRETDVVMAKPL